MWPMCRGVYRRIRRSRGTGRRGPHRSAPRRVRDSGSGSRLRCARCGTRRGTDSKSSTPKAFGVRQPPEEANARPTAGRAGLRSLQPSSASGPKRYSHSSGPPDSGRFRTWGRLPAHLPLRLSELQHTSSLKRQRSGPPLSPFLADEHPLSLRACRQQKEILGVQLMSGRPEPGAALNFGPGGDRVKSEWGMAEWAWGPRSFKTGTGQWRHFGRYQGPNLETGRHIVPPPAV